MEPGEDIVIVGAGIAGLATSLALHRLGIRSLVLESSHSLRTTGFAFTTWTNAWRALDAIGLGDYLRANHQRIHGNVAYSMAADVQTAELTFETKGKNGEHEVRCLQRRLLLEALANELPSGTIRFSSKVVSIEESGIYKVVHLADGNILRAKVLIGCDGVNSAVARWLGFKKPSLTGRSAIRAYVDFKRNHGLAPKFLQFNGEGFRSGFLPCSNTIVYWFFTWTPSNKGRMIKEDPAEIKRYVLDKLEKVPDEFKSIVENTNLDSITSSPLTFRNPWDILWGNISKGNVCVAGDAFHPMTPDLGQGACSALEDSVVLARCLAQALLKKPSERIEEKAKIDIDELKRIEIGLKNYAKERRWRGIMLITTSLMVGFFQQGDNNVLNFIRDKILANFMAGLLLKKADFDCGKLSKS